LREVGSLLDATALHAGRTGWAHLRSIARIGRFTLLEAARQVSALHPAADLFSPGWSLLVLLAWSAAGLAAAAILITRRDA
jgi:hypothetical protein